MVSGLRGVMAVIAIGIGIGLVTAVFSTRVIGTCSSGSRRSTRSRTRPLVVLLFALAVLASLIAARSPSDPSRRCAAADR